MIRTWVCRVCGRAYEVSGSEEEVSGLLNESEYPCITPLCRGRLNKITSRKEWVEANPRVLEPISLRSFFRAVMGFGKFEGSAASLERVRELFLSGTIVEVVSEPVGNPERTILHQLVFKDGTRLHFGASSKGACCYYVEASGPSCVEVLDREQSPDVVHDEAVVEGSDQNREEVGRSPK